MIVGAAATEDANTGRTTLDELFRRAAVRNPDAVALADPDDRVHFTDGEPRQLTYAQADRVIWAIAARLRTLGLQTDAVIGVQLPNTVESILTLLGILRAGMIPALLPMLWRETEIVAALSGVGARAIVTTLQIGADDHCAIAGRVAAGLFSIRQVCAFGNNVPDGIVPLDDVFDATAEMRPPPHRDGNPAAHVAAVTFEPATRGLLPVPRSHAQLIVAGDAIVTGAELAQDTVLLSATPPTSFAGLVVTLLPWLLTGGRLMLHQPFEPRLFRYRIEAQHCDAALIPGPLVGAFADIRPETQLIALWRAPERRDDARLPRPILDVTAFGEFGLHIAARPANEQMIPLPLGRVTDTLETRRGAKGALLLRGATVAAPGLDAADVPDDGFVDTGYPCRADTGAVIVTGPQAGMISIGGYRITRAEVDAFAAAVSVDNPIAALPDALLGQRLRGRTSDPAAIRSAARGINPLIAGAFR
jgi:non-ribosomal peptide synthetase component E (peptide arylation enzyme)